MLCFRGDVIKQLCGTSPSRLAVLDCLLHLLTTSPFPTTSGDRLKASLHTSQLAPEVVMETLCCVLTLVKEREIGDALEVCLRYR
jgi:hypothetical protein